MLAEISTDARENSFSARIASSSRRSSNQKGKCQSNSVWSSSLECGRSHIGRQGERENDDAAIFPLYVFPLSCGRIWISVVAVILLYLIQFDKNECHFSREENAKTTFLLFPLSLALSRSYLVGWPSFLKFVVSRKEETRKDFIFRCRRTSDLPTSLISLVPSIDSVNKSRGKYWVLGECDSLQVLVVYFM